MAIILKTISSLYSKKILIFSVKLVFFLEYILTQILIFISELFFISPYYSTILFLWYITFIWYILHKIYEPLYLDNKYYQFFNNIHKILCYNSVYKTVLASPSFFGAGALIVVGAVSLNNDISSGLDVLTDNITKVVIEVENVLNYFELATDKNATLPSLVADRKLKWWSTDELPKFRYGPPGPDNSSNQVLLAIKDKFINNGNILHLKLQDEGLTSNYEFNQYLPVSKIVRLIGESELQGVKVYLHPNGNFGTIKFLKENAISNNQTSFDLLVFKKACAKSWYDLDNKQVPESLSVLKLLTEPFHRLIREESIIQPTLQVSQSSISSNFPQPSQSALNPLFIQPSASTLNPPSLQLSHSLAAPALQQASQSANVYLQQTPIIDPVFQQPLQPQPSFYPTQSQSSFYPPSIQPAQIAPPLPHNPFIDPVLHTEQPGTNQALIQTQPSFISESSESVRQITPHSLNNNYQGIGQDIYQPFTNKDRSS